MKRFLKYVAVIIGFFLCIILMMIISSSPILAGLVMICAILFGFYMFFKHIAKPLVDDWESKR